MNCNDAKHIDIVKFLAKNGIVPDYIQGINHWYKSPLRNEKNPSFKVNSYKNQWYDFGIGDGGDIIDLVIKTFHVDYSNALRILSKDYDQHVKEQIFENSKVIVTDIREISKYQLVNYAKYRKLNIEIVKKYCKEVSFNLKSKNFYSLGFENNSKGFELRCKYFKGSSSPKDMTLIKNNSNKLLVFEGFIDFLSWFSCSLFFPGQHDYLILNSLSFLERCKKVIVLYDDMYLFLDNDEAGKRATIDLLSLKDCVDMSKKYSGFKDLNDFLMNKQS